MNQVMSRTFGCVMAVGLILGSVTSVVGQPVDPADPVVRYDDHKLVRVQIENGDQFRIMNQISPDMWSHRAGVGMAVDYRVAPEAIADLDAAGLTYEIVIDDLQELIDAERNGGGAEGGWFSQYRSYNEVSNYIDTLVALRPDLATRIELGDSLQGRNMSGIRITNTNGGAPAVFLNGCQHAREWVAVMVPMFVADTLIRQYDTDSRIKAMVDRVEFIIVPIVNPDGYEYSRTNDRFWRKNRRSNYGVDLNRNFSVAWGGSGSSGNRNSETYRGSAPFSEPESQNIRDFVDANPSIEAHIDFHSYSQLILQPWAYTTTLPPDHEELDDLGGRMSDEIRAVHNRFYEHGPGGRVLYLAAGTMPDWTYGEKGILGYTFELRDTGNWGFLLPESQIIPNGEEVVPAVLEMAEHVAGGAILLESTPLIAGQNATITVTGQSNAETRVYYTLRGTASDACNDPVNGVFLDLIGCRLGGSGTSDGSGQMVFDVFVPQIGGLPRVIWMQASQPGEESNMLITQINN